MVASRNAQGLGQRPRLVLTATLEELASSGEYQMRLLDAAAALLRPGGTLVYSTCTVSAEENERVVEHALRRCPVALRLAPPPPRLLLGGPGWAGCGLSEAERHAVQRFDPGSPQGAGCIGFFVAKLVRVE